MTAKPEESTREQLELEKLRLEIRQLELGKKRSWWWGDSLSSWFGVIIALIAYITFWQTGLFDVKQERLEFETAKLQEKKTLLAQETQASQLELESVKASLDIFTQHEQALGQLKKHPGCTIYLGLWPQSIGVTINSAIPRIPDIETVTSDGLSREIFMRVFEENEIFDDLKRPSGDKLLVDSLLAMQKLKRPLLRQLELANVRLSEHELRLVASLSGLERLTLKNVSLRKNISLPPSDGFEDALSLHELSVSLSAGKIDPAELEELPTIAFATCRSIKKLTLSGDGFNDQWLHNINDFFRSYSALDTAYIRSSAVTPESVQAISDENPSKVLHLEKGGKLWTFPLDGR